MKPNAVVYAAAAALLMTACDAAAPTAVKQMALPSNLKPAPAASSYITNLRDLDWLAVEPNPCNGETVTITGSMHWVIVTGFDATGGYHYAATIVAKGTGVSATKTYKVNEQFKEIDQVPGSFTKCGA